MPFYEYKCLECGYTFSKKQNIQDDTYPECPKCHGTTKRLIQSPGLVFKGQGFYATDYQNNSASPSKKSSPGKKQD